MLAVDGCAVVLHGRDAAKAQAVAASGEIDILVNNAGGAVGTSGMRRAHDWEGIYQLHAIAARA